MTVNQPPRRSIQLENVATTYLDVGQGDTLVALHGIPTSSLLFAPLLPHLTNYRVIAPDLLGIGHTATPSTGPLDYATYATHLCAFLEAVPSHQFHLLVHDVGGTLGLEWAAEHLERVKTVMILSATLTGSFLVGRALYMGNLILGQRFLRWGMRFTLKRARLETAWLEEWVTPWSRRRILQGSTILPLIISNGYARPSNIFEYRYWSCGVNRTISSLCRTHHTSCGCCRTHACVPSNGVGIGHRWTRQKKLHNA